MLTCAIFRQPPCEVGVLGTISSRGCRRETAKNDSWRPVAVARYWLLRLSALHSASRCAVSRRSTLRRPEEPSGAASSSTNRAVPYPPLRYFVRSAHGVVLQSAATAADGTFTIQGLPVGSYWLEVAAPHFQVHRLSLEIGGNDVAPLRVVLGLAPMQSEVIVFGGEVYDEGVDARRDRRIREPVRWRRSGLSTPMGRSTARAARSCRTWWSS